MKKEKGKTLVIGAVKGLVSESVKIQEHFSRFDPEVVALSVSFLGSGVIIPFPNVYSQKALLLNQTQFSIDEYTRTRIVKFHSPRPTFVKCHEWNWPDVL